MKVMQLTKIMTMMVVFAPFTYADEGVQVQSVPSTSVFKNEFKRQAYKDDITEFKRQVKTDVIKAGQVVTKEIGAAGDRFIKRGAKSHKGSTKKTKLAKSGLRVGATTARGAVGAVSTGGSGLLVAVPDIGRRSILEGIKHVKNKKLHDYSKGELKKNLEVDIQSKNNNYNDNMVRGAADNQYEEEYSTKKSNIKRYLNNNEGGPITRDRIKEERADRREKFNRDIANIDLAPVRRAKQINENLTKKSDSINTKARDKKKLEVNQLIQDMKVASLSDNNQLTAQKPKGYLKFDDYKIIYGRREGLKRFKEAKKVSALQKKVAANSNEQIKLKNDVVQLGNNIARLEDFKANLSNDKSGIVQKSMADKEIKKLKDRQKKSFLGIVDSTTKNDKLAPELAEKSAKLSLDRYNQGARLADDVNELSKSIDKLKAKEEGASGTKKIRQKLRLKRKKQKQAKFMKRQRRLERLQRQQEG
jgi:hypothetical protein